MRLKVAIATTIIVLLTAIIGLLTEGLKFYRELATPIPTMVSVAPTASPKIPLAATSVPTIAITDEILRACAFAGLTSQTPLSINVDAALYRAGQNNGLGFAQSNEIPFVSGSALFLVQDFNAGIAFVRQDDWGNVKILKKPIDVTQVSDATAKEAMELADQFRVRINANSLLMKVAQIQNLGYPRTGEFKFSCRNETYVGQLFAAAIAYIREKDNEIGSLPYP